jgi:hypothetical protein
MSSITFSEPLFTHLYNKLWNEQSSLESAAILFMDLATGLGTPRFLVREVVIVPPEAYEVRTGARLQLSSIFIARMTKRALVAKQSLGFVHTHPFDLSDSPQFSIIDDAGENRLAPFLLSRTKTPYHVAVVLSKEGASARILGSFEELSVISVGTTVRLYSNITNNNIISNRFDRQVRAFGKDGQQILNHLRVGIVGCGGTGSAIIQSLALLGIKSFCIIDPDTVSETNLNRLIGATYSDLNLPKVQVASRMIRSIQSEADISIIQGDVTSLSIAKQLLNMDLIFSCTDSHGSRAILNQIAYQYLIPVIDMGVSITVRNGVISHITGRVQMLSPGLGCLVCGNLLDSNQVRWDFMRTNERMNDPYFLGEGEPAPSVVTLNTTVASLAMSMFLSAMIGVPMQARNQFYDGIKGFVRAVSVTPVGGCIICSSSGMLARGDAYPLPGRID